jgi:hypothetical protein
MSSRLRKTILPLALVAGLVALASAVSAARASAQSELETCSGSCYDVADCTKGCMCSRNSSSGSCSS